MDIVEILNQAAHAFGPSGQETEISSFFADKFRPYVDEVYVDNLYNVIAHKKGKGPKVMLSAHQDEICCVVSKIEGNGALRLWRVGGIDPKVLPGCRVIIHTKQKKHTGNMLLHPSDLA